MAECLKLCIHYGGAPHWDSSCGSITYSGDQRKIITVEEELVTFQGLVYDIERKINIPKEKMKLYYRLPHGTSHEQYEDLDNEGDLLKMVGKISNVMPSKKEKERKKIHDIDVFVTVVMNRRIGTGRRELSNVRNEQMHEQEYVVEEPADDECDEEVHGDEGPHDDEKNYNEDDATNAEHYTELLRDTTIETFEVDDDVIQYEPVLLSDESGEEVESVYVDDHTMVANSTLVVGMEFKDAISCKKAIREYAIKERFNIVFPRNTKEKIVGKCASPQCTWRCYARVKQDNIGFCLKTLNATHNCMGNYGLGEKTVTQQWVADKVKDRLHANENYSPKLLMNEIMHETGICLNYKKVWRGIYIAMHEVYGSVEDPFKKVHSFCAAMKRANPGSIVEYEIHPYTTFRRLFMSIRGCVEGFLRGCRPLIFLDGCHLKSRYKGILLSAVAYDGNNGILPVGVAVVEQECMESWEWFLGYLAQAIGDGDFCFMSDRQKGLLAVVSRLFSTSSHRFCMRHFYANLKTYDFGKSIAVRDCFWRAARAYTRYEWGACMEQLQRLSVEAYQYVMKESPIHWSRAFFKDDLPCNSIENNIAESWNSLLRDLRHWPVCELFDGIRIKMMRIFDRRRNLSSHAWNELVVPRASKKVLENKRAAKWVIVRRADEFEYEVDCDDGRHILHLARKTCSCRQWQIDGIPCKHVCAVQIERRVDPEDLCAPYFHCTTYRATYEGIIHAMPDCRFWDIVPGSGKILPPAVKRGVGRPKINRRCAADEGPHASQSHTVRCGNCGNPGHNRKTCKHLPKESISSSSSHAGTREKIAVVRGRGNRRGQC